MGPHEDRGKLWLGWDSNPRPSDFDHRCSFRLRNKAGAGSECHGILHLWHRRQVMKGYVLRRIGRCSARSSSNISTAKLFISYTTTLRSCSPLFLNRLISIVHSYNIYLTNHVFYFLYLCSIAVWAALYTCGPLWLVLLEEAGWSSSWRDTLSSR